MGSQYVASRLANDPDFLARLTVAAAQAGEKNPQEWAYRNALACVLTTQEPLEKYGQVINDPYRDKPAANPSILSDTHVNTMVQRVQEAALKNDQN